MKFLKGNGPVLIIIIAISLMGCGEKKTPETEPVSESEQYISLDTSNFSDLSRGDTLSIKVDDSEVKYQLVVRRVEEAIPGIMSISANVGDVETGAANLIFREGRLSGFMDIYEPNERWQIEYNDEKDAYYLKEIKPEDRDELEGGVPLTPPNDGH